ncbi:hypothetical protein [Melittangium boletus]|uniref:Uncharacterized protein n=1 Tax=Melittangium boletus DSM 14713 TaxID=1294270 RepID=A0A250IH06_9BACT|nr:hypothetical protein [Melittangium boletus]ATB30513.1 hypothetical protein MEBOL_003974 [Melittangium boletus DSM 14713]
MATLKTLLTFILAGAFLGLATASWLGPKWLEWDNTPRLQATQMMCNLPEVIRGVTQQLLHYQFMGTLVGAGIMLVLGIVFVVSRAKKQKQQRAGQPPLTPPSPGPSV